MPANFNQPVLAYDGVSAVVIRAVCCALQASAFVLQGVLCAGAATVPPQSSRRLDLRDLHQGIHRHFLANQTDLP